MRLRRRNPTAFSTLPFSLPEYGLQNLASILWWERNASNTLVSVTCPFASRCPAPVALSSTSTGGTPPTCPNTESSPWHRHSAFSPGMLATYLMFECGNVTTRQWSSTHSPAIRARATPKSTCAVPGPTPIPRTRPTASGRPASTASRTAGSWNTPRRSPSPSPGGRGSFARHQPVGLQPPVHQMRVRVDLRTIPTIPGRPGGAILHPSVPRDRGTVHVQPARYLGMEHALPVEPPDILLFGHRYRQYPFLPESRRRQPADESMVLQLGNITGMASRCPSHKGILPIMRKTSCLHCGKTLPNLLKKH